MLLRPLNAALVALALILPAQGALANQGHTGATEQAMKPGQKRALRKAAAELELARAELKQAVAVAEANTKPSKGRIWCVPFARAVTGVEIKGNAVTWWKQAAARYERGSDPKIGAVMNFRGTKKMPMGHVAVVSNIIDSRRIQIDHANWVRNRITKDQLVIDVSAANDWSEVRVVNADGSMGRVNPIFGFIYN
ncbi:CHAP domain-containing protein [Gemmobacter serpentinus]|uniref:CHAP domain-containing protein n=1 Tax=Gemmobacter serpentinus TaxID=2652247 RepID=UPI001CF62E88|nr:CHAP domain-containing protein [Gemmobacter serpentinus]